MLVWIKNHPLMTGGVVLLLVVLFLVFRGKSSSGTQVIQTGPSDAAQTAGLQAQVQLAAINAGYASHISDLNAAVAGKQVDATTALQLTSAQRDVALQGILSGADSQNRQTQAALDASTRQDQALVQSQQITSDAGVKITGIQADVINNQTAAQLAAQGIISGASVDMANIQAGTDQARIAAALASSLDTNRTSLDATKDTNAAVVTVAGISGDTAKTIATLDAASKDLLTRTAGNVYTDQIDSQTKNIGDWISAQFQLGQNKDNVVQNLVLSGQLNKGGEGGKNQAGVIETWLGNFTGGVANASQTPDTVGSTASGFSGIAKSFFDFMGHVF